MERNVQLLLAAQSDIHGRIARAMVNLKKLGTANITAHAATTRLTILDQLWAKFEAQHESLREAYKEAFDESEYNTSQFFDSAENTYILQRSLLNDQLLRLQGPTLTAAAPAATGFDPTAKTSLPRVRIRPFSGAFKEWPSFRDLFLSVVGSNSSISNVEKFHHLKCSVEGPAERLIRPFNVTDENYSRAWALLIKHYENKKELSRSNFAAFTAVAKMKGDTADELSRIYIAVTSAVSGQESIGRPIQSYGMDLFNHLIVELFDPKTRLAWEDHSSNSREPSDHKTLMDFITTRALTLNAAKPKSAKVSGDLPRSAKAHFAKRTSDSAQCVLCKEKHNVMMCEQFKAKSASDRKAVAETHRLCLNCLGLHPYAKCQSTKTCSTCKACHHSLLHNAYVSKQPAEAIVMSAVHHNEERKAILLATAKLHVYDRHGDFHAIRALIDQGSEVSLVSEALVQRLRLPRSRSAVTIFGVGGFPSGASRGKVTLRLTSPATGSTLTAVAFILPRLSLYQGQHPTRSPGPTCRTCNSPTLTS